MLPALWLVAQLVGPLRVKVPVRHWGLLAPHADSVPFYARALLSLLGWPGLVLVLLGLGLALREARRGGDAPLFIVATFAALSGFFVFLYDFDAERFLVYPIWMAGLLSAGALARLPRPAFAVAAVLLIAGSALPLGTHARVRSAWESRQVSARIDPELVRQDRSALYLYQQPSAGGGRYRVITRLGNALLKRVKYVPVAWFEPWWPRLEVKPVGRIGTDGVYRIRLPGVRETWLFVAPGRLNGGMGRETAAGLRQAQLINAHLEGWDGYVALIPGEGPPQPWQLYLPFLVETTELYVPQPGQEQEILEIFAAAPNLGERRIGPVVVRRTEILGRRASLVRGTAARRR